VVGPSREAQAQAQAQAPKMQTAPVQTNRGQGTQASTTSTTSTTSTPGGTTAAFTEALERTAALPVGRFGLGLGLGLRLGSGLIPTLTLP